MAPRQQGTGQMRRQLDPEDTPESQALRKAADIAIEMLMDTARTVLKRERTNNHLSTPHASFANFVKRLTVKVNESEVATLAGVNMFKENFKSREAHWDKLVRICEHAVAINHHPMRMISDDILNFIKKYHMNTVSHDKVVSLIRKTFKYVGKGMEEDGKGGIDAINPVTG
jgi:hypothetical protein